MKLFPSIQFDPAPPTMERGGAIVDDTQAPVEEFSTDDFSSDDGPAFDLSDITAPTDKPSTVDLERQKTGLPPGIKPKENKSNEPIKPKSGAETDKSGTEEETNTGEEDKTASGDEDETDAKDGEAAPDPAPSPKGNRRDYSPFGDDEVKVLKKLGNKEFAQVAPLLQKHKAAALELGEVKIKNQELLDQLAGKGVPQNWYEHPTAYTLTPEFNNVNNQYKQLSFESNHLQRQLEAIEAGEQWVAVVGYKDGQPVFSDPQDASPVAKARIMSALAQAGARKAQLESAAENIRTNFKARYESDITGLNNSLDQQFNTLAPELKPKEEFIKAFLPKLPASVRGQALATNLAKAISVIINQGQELDKLRVKAGVKVAAKVDKKLAGPGASVSRPAPKADGKSGRVKEFSLSDILGEAEE